MYIQRDYSILCVFKVTTSIVCLLEVFTHKSSTRVYSFISIESDYLVISNETLTKLLSISLDVVLTNG